jgi:hypothetical protein
MAEKWANFFKCINHIKALIILQIYTLHDTLEIIFYVTLLGRSLCKPASVEGLCVRPNFFASGRIIFGFGRNSLLAVGNTECNGTPEMLLYLPGMDVTRIAFIRIKRVLSTETKMCQNKKSFKNSQEKI